VLLHRRLRPERRSRARPLRRRRRLAREAGRAVERFNLSQQPGAFAETPAVKEALGRGTEVLPLVLVGDRIAVEGAYPSRETLAALAGVVVKKARLRRAQGRVLRPAAARRPKPGCC
jgi:hypothetical protein